MIEPPRSRSRNGLVVIGVLVPISVLFDVIAHGQAPNREPTQVASSQGPTPYFFSANDCARCHRPNEGEPPLIASEVRLPPLVRLDEFKTWSESDKHRRAFDALTGARGQVMGKRLGMNVAEARDCLSCHGTGLLPKDPDPQKSGAWDSREQGVGCIACHGPYKEWVVSHGTGEQLIREWRQKSSHEKTNTFGMTDLREPEARAHLCYSCHVGSADEGKVVTHAMYAAGHPPLPGIEPATYCDAMPPHWWKPNEVPLFAKDPAARARFHAEWDALLQSNAVVIGGLVALRDFMRELESEAKREAAPVASGTRLHRDYGRLACYACHHDLKTPTDVNWRMVLSSARRPDNHWAGGAPGRPQFRPWPLALSRLALASIGRDTSSQHNALVKHLQALRAAFNARPFGEAAQVAVAARDLADWADTMILAVRSSRFDRSTPPRLLASLVALSEDEFPDYDSARQIAWAFKTIYEEWRPEPSHDDPIRKVIADLNQMLKLNPYASRQERTKLAHTSDPNSNEIRHQLIAVSEKEYKLSFASAADFESVTFKEKLVALHKLLGIPPIR
jgi:hypothetical protein